MSRAGHLYNSKTFKNIKNVKSEIFYVFVPVEESYVCPGPAI
jgi:hypothetical protein